MNKVGLDTETPFYFLAGCTKSATTWLWKCAVEHPEINVPVQLDRINFFTIHYQKGLDWYSDFFNSEDSHKVYFDPTPEYLKDPLAPKRIFEFRPDARFIFALRNPIDRAVSLWWHQRRKKRINFDFEDVFNRKGIGSFGLYDEWVVSGFYQLWIDNFLEYFPRENMKVMIYDDLQSDSKTYIQEFYRFLGVEENFVPSVLDSVVNPSNQHSVLSKLGFGTKVQKNVLEINDDLRQELQEIFEPHNRRLGEFLNRDLSIWK